MAAHNAFLNMDPFEIPILAPTPQPMPASKPAEASHSTIPSESPHQTVRIHVSSSKAIDIAVGPSAEKTQNGDPRIPMSNAARLPVARSKSPMYDPFQAQAAEIPVPPWKRTKAVAPAEATDLQLKQMLQAHAPSSSSEPAMRWGSAAATPCFYNKTLYRSWPLEPMEPMVTEATSAATSAAEFTMWSAAATPNIPGSAKETGNETGNEKVGMSKRARERLEGRIRPKSNNPRSAWFSRFHFLSERGMPREKILEQLGPSPESSVKGKGKRK